MSLWQLKECQNNLIDFTDTILTILVGTVEKVNVRITCKNIFLYNSKGNMWKRNRAKLKSVLRYLSYE